MPLPSPPPLSLYVHLPWCVRKCPYCDFNSYAVRGSVPQEAYIEALKRDLQAQALTVRGRPVISIFFGGGTPSLFAPESVGRIIEMARAHLTVAPDVEITLEANPGTIERGRFAGYRDAGVNRVSLGAQSFDAAQLQRLGRTHTPSETVRAVEELHAAGLDNFNLDLMYALPGQTVEGALADIEQALQLHPAQLSHYQLTLEPGTLFAANPPALPSDDLAAEMLDACQERLAAAGFEQYEVSAYARRGRQCRHNLNYWRFGDYLGVGAGAHGKLTDVQSAMVFRTRQPREPRRYQAASPGGIARAVVPKADLPFEFMMNALRLTGGFETELFEARTGLDWGEVAEPVGRLAARGLLEIHDGTCKPTRAGVRFVNEMLLGFLPEKPVLPGKRVMSMGS